MAKKIYDIVPPKEVPKKSAPVVLASGEKIPKPKRTRTKVAKAAPVAVITPVVEPKKDKKFPLKELLIAVAIVVVLLGAYAYIKLQKADVQIWPTTQTINLQPTITADTSTASPDVDLATIPAQSLSVQKDGQQNFPATGLSSSQGLASGTIKLYNTLSPAAPFVLLSGTHFLSESGQYFVSTQAVTIPAAKGNTPGSINVPVQAQSPGSSYNIGPAKFSLPKLSGSAYYYGIYGQSNAAMAGGYTGSQKQVSQDDISGAADVLTKQLLSQAEASLKNQLTSDDILLTGATVENVVETNPSVKAGTVADNFNEEAQVTVSALVFKKEDIQSYITALAQSQLSSTETFLEKSLQTTYALVSLNMPNGKMTFSVQASIKKYQNINTDNLANAFSGKSSPQIKQILDQLYPGAISELKINFWPFWVISAPSDANKITVQLLFK